MLVIIIGRIVQTLLLLATIKASTYMLSPREFGKTALMASIIAFISYLLINPVGMYVNRQLHSWNNQGLIKHHFFYYWIYIACMAVTSALILAFANAFTLKIPLFHTGFVMVFILCSIFFNTMNQTTIPSLNLLGFRAAFSILSNASSAFSLLLALFMVYYWGSLAENWLLGILAGQIVWGLVGMKYFYASVNENNATLISKPKLQNLLSVFAFSWPIALAVGLNWIQSQSYRFFINQSFGLATLGLFVAGYSISSGVFGAFESLFTTYFQPKFYKNIADHKGKESLVWNEYAASIIPSLILLFFGITALAPQLTNLLLGQQYQGAAIYMVWGALIEMLRVLSNVYTLAAHAKKNTLLLIIPNLIGAIVALVLIYSLSPIWGIKAIGFALIAAGLMVSLCLHLSLKKQLVLTIPVRQSVQALGFGLIIWLVDYYMRFFIDPESNIYWTLAHIGLIGIIMLATEFLLLRTFFQIKE